MTIRVLIADDQDLVRTGLAMILFLGRDKSLPIPFGPYLAAAGWISLLWGAQINRFYLEWAGL